MEAKQQACLSLSLTMRLGGGGTAASHRQESMAWRLASSCRCIIVVCILQAFFAEPSHVNASVSEAKVMSDRAAGCHALPTVCKPSTSTNPACACGLPWSHAAEQSATRQGVQSYIFHTAKLQPVKVLQLLCACGQVDAILNLNNVDLFTHEVLKG